MRTLVISDIHGNRAALEAVAREPHDSVVCLGDIVGYGPEPAVCLDWIRRHAGMVIQGNHDRAAGEDVPPRCSPAFTWLAEATTPIGARQLDRDARAYLAARPRAAALTIDGLRCVLVHAAPSDPLYRYLAPDPEAWEREVGTLDADLVLVGHTHLQFLLELGARRVLNPGSVGQPKDGNPRAAYAVIEDGRIELKRVAYPVERTVAALAASSIDPAAAQALGRLLRSGRSE
jgi:putative phosphoesterase